MSYLGSVSAGISELGLVFNLLSQGTLSISVGMVIGAAIIMLYILFGGMWSVALTDFFQLIVIGVGLLYITYVVSNLAGGTQPVIQHAAAAGKFTFMRKLSTADILAFVAAWVTMMFGSIPQQDVFQRVMSAKGTNIGVIGSIAGGSLYFLFAFVPIFLAYFASMIDPKWLPA